MKFNSIQIIGILEGEEKKHRRQTLLEVFMTENFMNLERGKPTEVQEAQRVPIKMNTRRTTQDTSELKLQVLKTKRES